RRSLRSSARAVALDASHGTTARGADLECCDRPLERVAAPAAITAVELELAELHQRVVADERARERVVRAAEGARRRIGVAERVAVDPRDAQRRLGHAGLRVAARLDALGARRDHAL